MAVGIWFKGLYQQVASRRPKKGGQYVSGFENSFVQLFFRKSYCFTFLKLSTDKCPSLLLFPMIRGESKLGS